ncbi:MAG: carboxypeptidase-like regulatory domain-containing protein, partial [Aquaticitalea sp.]
SLELIKVNGRYIDFELGGSDYKSNSFTRLSNQDEWKRFPQIGMAMKLRTSYPSDKGKIIPKLRPIPKNITIYWDASLTMKNGKRDLKKELDLLEKYLKELKDVNVRIIKFSALTLDQHEFNLSKGNADGIIDYLRNTNYEGEASFSKVLKTNDFEADIALLFSCAETILEPLDQSIYLPTFSINSNPEANHVKLQTASFYGDGYYIDLSKASVREALEMMFTEYYDNASYEETVLGAGKINGSVISDSLVISRASIRVKNTLIETASDNNGHFSVEAKKGDILLVNALGMFEKEMTLSNNSDVEINLTPNTTLLNEVTLYGKTKQKIVTVLTPYGEKNVDAIGYSANELTKDDISPGDITFDDVIRKIPGVLISGVGSSKRYSFLVNVFSSTGVYTDTNPIIVIDEMIYFQKDGLDHLPPIDIKTIQSIRAIKSLVGTNRYGGAGAYGAIEIRTQATSLNKNVDSKTREDSALAKGNDYLEEGIPLLDGAIGLPDYIKELNKATSYEEAKSIYENQKVRVPMTIAYILGVSEYFKKWNLDFAYIVLTNIAAMASENVKALKTLAFKLEENQNFITSKLVFQRIAELRPTDAQSYRDLANSYQETGDYDKAMNLYKQMLSNSIEGVDFTGLHLPIIDELKHFLAFHRSEVEFTDLPPELLTANFKQDLRLVFEWNDPNAEFEIQFVNPQKKFYKWPHTILENRERMLDEIKNGYTTEAYIIDDAEAGEWIINIEALNEKPSINPNYLKYTIYKNYGLANETKTVKVIQLEDIKQKVTLDTFRFH